MRKQSPIRCVLPPSSTDSAGSIPKHLSPQQLKEYGLGRTPESMVDHLEQHLLECPDCMILLDQLSTDGLVEKIKQSENCLFSVNEEVVPIKPAPLKLTAGYEIREEIGRGGMGVVYRAWQPGLGRYVALKRLINADIAGRKAFDRFRNEATVLAAIKHPCIVDVYDVGEQDGQPYIAMELVDGITLAKMLHTKPLDSRTAAQLLVQLSDAVAVANSQGIIHRDLKPQNVLITTARSASSGEIGSDTRFLPAPTPNPVIDSLQAHPVASNLHLGDGDGLETGISLTPKLVDFGLSHLHVDGNRITETAELLGTPGYMAPEQLQPEASVTDAADVYGLGAILYQCLTGRAPFQGATAVETIAMVLSSDILPVARLRRDVPRDLQIICHHCLQKVSKHRYASADALRDDLCRFLAGMPILAKSPGWLRRLVLWTRRNKVVAALSAAILVGIILGSGIVASYQYRLRTERDDAKRRYADARSTIWKIIDSASTQSIFEIPKLQELLSTQARESMPLFEQLAREEGSEQAIIDLARLRILLGTLAIGHGDPAEGEQLLKKANEAIANITFQNRGTAELLKMTIAGQVKLATSLYGQGKTSASLEVLIPAKRCAEAMLIRQPNSSDNLNQVAWVYHVSGSAKIGMGDPITAKEDFRKAIELRNKALELEPRNSQLTTLLAGSMVNLALCECTLGNLDQGLKGYRRVIEMMKAIQPLDPKSSGNAIVLAGARLNASNILADRGERETAMELLNEGIRELQPFFDASPEDYQFREYMFKLVGNRAKFADTQTAHDQVIADWNRAIELAYREEDRKFCREQLELHQSKLRKATERPTLTTHQQKIPD
jgi:serine/threonine protein kinase